MANVARVPVDAWGDALTPWPAPALRPDGEPFGGHATATLAELVGERGPAAERAGGLAPSARSICGYSLGGLFALYAFTREERFCAGTAARWTWRWVLGTTCNITPSALPRGSLCSTRFSLGDLRAGHAARPNAPYDISPVAKPRSTSRWKRGDTRFSLSGIWLA